MSPGGLPPCPQSKNGECPNDDGRDTNQHLGDGATWACGACGRSFSVDRSVSSVMIVRPEAGFPHAKRRGNVDTSASNPDKTQANGGTARPDVCGLGYARFCRLMALMVGTFAFCSLVWAAAGASGVGYAATVSQGFAALAALASLVGETLRRRAGDE